MTIPILYSDRDLAVCVKPRGVSSEQGGLPELLAAQLGDEHVRCVHRLDAAVGGVMVYARSSRAAAGLSRQIGPNALIARSLPQMIASSSAANAAIISCTCSGVCIAPIVVP